MGSKQIHSHGVLRCMWDTPQNTALEAQPLSGPHAPPLLGRVFLRHSALVLDVLLDPLEASGRAPDIYLTHSGNLSRNYTINSGKEETHLCDKNANSFGTCILH